MDDRTAFRNNHKNIKYIKSFVGEEVMDRFNKQRPEVTRYIEKYAHYSTTNSPR